MEPNQLATAAGAVTAVVTLLLAPLVTLIVWVVHRLFSNADADRKNADADRRLLVRSVRVGINLARVAHATSLRVETTQQSILATLQNGICKAGCGNYLPLGPGTPHPVKGDPHRDQSGNEDGR